MKAIIEIEKLKRENKLLKSTLVNLLNWLKRDEVNRLPEECEKKQTSEGKQ